MTGVRANTKSIVAALLCVALLLATFLVLVPWCQAPTASSKLVTSFGLSSHSKPRTLTSPKPQTSGYFGISIAVSGSTLVVGAYNENASGYEHAGRAYIFNATTGARIRTLRSPEPQGGGGFGDSVAISGTTVVVGAEGEGAGHVYVFNAMTGALIHTLTSPNPQFLGSFGISVAISGSTVVVGADNENASGYEYAGHVYIFKATSGALIHTLTSPNARTVGQFGFSVAISGTTAVIGATGENVSGKVGAGHAYVFKTTSGALISTLTSPNAQYEGRFGWSVAINDARVVVGALLETVSGNIGAGHVYVFRATTGALISTLTSPNAQTNGYFGGSVGVSGTKVVVGALTEDASGIASAGHAYVFKAASGTLISTLTSPNGQIDGNFGSSVAISGTTVMVGADFETASGHSEAGHAYVFQLT
jgi:hypothetical protein